MGFSISWIAVRGNDLVRFHELLGVIPTEEKDEANESPMSGAQLPGGWYVLFLNDVSHAIIDHERMGSISKGGELIACQVEEHVMASVAYCYKDGEFSWSAIHVSEKGIDHLEKEGDLPDFFSEVESIGRTRQQEAGGEQASVDHIFDVPLEAAERICGYRHDKWKFDWGTPQFTKVVEA